MLADLLLGEGKKLYVFSEDEAFSMKEGEEMHLSKADLCIGAAVREEDTYCFESHDGEALVIVGEVYGFRELKRLAERALEASTHDQIRETWLEGEGEAVAIMIKEKRMLGVRDELGCRTLYYGLRDGVTVMSNRRSIIERAGFEAKLVPAGSIVEFSEGEIKCINSWRRLPAFYDERISLEEAVEEVCSLLRNAIAKRSMGRLGVLFSGGLDSVLIAAMLSKISANFRLYCSGIEGSKDLENALSAGEEMGLKVKVKLMNEEEIEEALPKIVGLVGAEPLNVELSIPIFFALNLAYEEGRKQIVNGTGADELFGGYSKFITVLREGGYNALHSTLASSLDMLPYRDLAREEEIAGSANVLIRRPFLDAHLVKYVIKIPPYYKVREEKGEYVRKYVLKKIAERFQVPKSVVERRKLALQYGSGVHKALKRIASKKGFTKAKARGAGFKGELDYFLRAIKLKT